MGIFDRKSTVTEDETKAWALLLEWAQRLESQDPAAFRAITAVMPQARMLVMETVTNELQLPFTHNMRSRLQYSMDSDLGDLSKLFAEWAEKAAETPMGQVEVTSIWFDPPGPDPRHPFAVCWTEENTGFSPTGVYKSMVRVPGGRDETVDCSSLDAGATAVRRVEIGPFDLGTHTVVIFTPWTGSEESTINSPAGRLTIRSANVAIGAEASESEERQRQEVEINEALSQALIHISDLALLSPGGIIDVSSVNWALQAIAKVAPSIDAEFDLQGAGLQVLSRNPETIGADATSEAIARAKDAVVAIQAASTRTVLEGVSPVDHPSVSEAARALVAVATVINEAPVEPSAV